MSDRANTITVVLDNTTRVDDLEATLTAIRMIKGVMSADANVADVLEYMAESRAKFKLEQKLFNALRED